MRKKLFSIDDCQSLSLKEIRKLYKEHVNPVYEDVFSSFSIGQELVDYAEGVWIYTKSGKQVLDATGGQGVLNHGHNHPRILAARVKYQQQRRMEVHKTIFSSYLAALSNNVAAVLPKDLDYPFFCNSGAEAVDGAIKMAYKFHKGERQFILHSDISYHGKLLGSGSITASKELHFNFPKIPGTKSFAYGNIDSIQKLITDLRKADGTSDIYALIIEPFSASHFRKCDKEFLQALRKICDAERIVLVFDEVFSGWCKTGNFFYFMDYEVIPDILTMSKSLGGGKGSISAFVATNNLLKETFGNHRDFVLHSTTYNGFGEECITAIEAINIMVEDDYVSKSRNIGNLIVRRIELLLQKYPNQVMGYAGSGALFSIRLNIKTDLVDKVLKLLPVEMLKQDKFVTQVILAAFTDWLFSNYNIYAYFTPDGINFSPPLIIEEKEIDYFFDSFEKTLDTGFFIVASNFIANRLLKVFER
jgi:putrescine aminotransferase